LIPFLQEILKMGYDEEPNYGKLKFIMVKCLLDRGIAPNNNNAMSS